MPDVVFNSIHGEVSWLKNIGTRSQPEFAAAEPIVVAWEGAPPKPTWHWREPQGKQLITQWRTTPLVHDFTGDGLLDLAKLDPEGYLALYKRAKQGDTLTLMPPRRAFTDDSDCPLRLNERTAGGSGRRKLALCDWNGDGNLDLLLNSANAYLYLGQGLLAGHWRFKRSGALSPKNIEGHDVSPTTVDFNADGIPDFLGGAEDGRMYYLRNLRLE